MISPSDTYHNKNGKLKAPDNKQKPSDKSKSMAIKKTTLPSTKSNTPTLIPTKNDATTLLPTKSNTPTFIPTKNDATTLLATKSNTPTLIPTKNDAMTVLPTKSNTPTLIPTKNDATTLLPTKSNTPTLLPTKNDATTLLPTKSNTPTLIPTKNDTTTLLPTKTNTPTLIPTKSDTTALPTTQDDTTTINNTNQESFKITTSYTSITRTNSRYKSNYNKTNKWITSRILNQINYFEEPCDNFYYYTCTRNDTEFKHLSQNINTNDKRYFYMKTFYDSCINHETDFNLAKRIKNVEKLTNKIGNFMFNDNSNVFELSKLFEKLTIVQSNPLFDIGLDFAENSTNIALQITLPEGSALKNGLKSWSSSFSYHKKQCLQMENIKTHQSNQNLNEIYESYKNCCNNLTTYLNSIENTISNFECFKNLGAEKKSAEIKNIRSSVEKIFSILNKEMPLSKTNKIQFEYEEKIFNCVQISKLNRDMSQIIQWENFFKSLTKKSYISPNTTIQVYFMDYFSKMFQFLSQMDQRELNNALLAIYSNDLFMNTAIPRETDKRDQFCSDLSKQLLPTVWLDLLLQETSSNNHKKYYNSTTIQELFIQLKTKLKSDINNSFEYSDDLPNMLIKIDNLQIELISSSEKVSNHIQDTQIGNDFQTNLIYLLSLLRHNVYSLAGAPITNKNLFSYFIDPLSTKPISFYQNNIIAVPMGLLDKGIFFDMPDYVTLARVGFHIAREIFRHFDLIGKDKNMTLKEDTVEIYLEFRNETLRKIVKSAEIFQGTNKITVDLNNTNLPINEVIRTDAAFKLILNIFEFAKIELPYLEPILGKQVEDKFFQIISAQEFCENQEIGELAVNLLEKMQLSGELLVNNFGLSSEKFSQTFSCKPGQQMNPAEILKLNFPYMSEQEVDEEDPKPMPDTPNQAADEEEVNK